SFRHAHDVRVPAVRIALEDLHGAQLWIDDPIPAHAERRVLEELLQAIEPRLARGRHDDLAHDARGRVNQAIPGGKTIAGKEDGEVRHPTRARRTGVLDARAEDEDSRSIGPPIADGGGQDRNHDLVHRVWGPLRRTTPRGSPARRHSSIERSETMPRSTS